MFYGTDRLREGVGYGSERGTEVVYGSARVNIPRTHEVGTMETQGRWRKLLRAKVDYDTDMFLVGPPKEMTAENFYKGIVASSKKGEVNVLVFVHGFNVSFEDSILRTAQITYDLRKVPNLVPIAYTWPSQGSPSLFGYTKDENSASVSTGNFADFIENLTLKTHADNVYILAHSMGTRVATGGVREVLIRNPAMKGRFTELILAAPDLDKDLFAQYAKVLASYQQPTTVYFSSKDKAMLFSTVVNGPGRLGKGGYICDGIDFIDATKVDPGFLGHSYYGDNRMMLVDIAELVSQHKSAADRMSIVAVPGPPPYWEFP